MNIQNLLFFDKKGDRHNFNWNGNYWEGSVLFPVVSERLFEIEHVFIIEKFINSFSLQTEYGFPHSDTGSPSVPVWRTRWESDYDGKTDVTSIIYTYELGVDPDLDAPYLIKANNVELYPEVVPGDVIDSPSGLTVTSQITSGSMQFNVALNSDVEGIYDRTLILEDFTDSSNPITILKLEFHGEVEGEDSRLSVLLGNFGRQFTNTDSLLIRETDPKEPLPDWTIVNRKRKELLLAGESIFPYLGSYKSLFNAIKFFGYYDLRIKEYWLNVKTDSADSLTPLQQNTKTLKALKLGQNKSSELIENLLSDENKGKFKQVEIYGKKRDGTFGLKKQYEEIFPSKSYKKTSLFGLFYDINSVSESKGEDQFGYPIVEDSFLFSPEEVLIKLFGLKERLKADYLPLNARIIDITGEGVYFNVYKTRGWVDQLKVDELKSGIEVDFSVFPKRGFIEDLRVFYTKPNQQSLLYPAVDGTSPGISYLGNTIEPYSFFQKYPASSVRNLANSVFDFHKKIENGDLPKFLGDGDFDPPGYRLFSNGDDFVYPAGFPVVLTNKTFNLSWNELGVSWESLDPNFLSTPLDISSYFSTSVVNPGYPVSSVFSITSLDLSLVEPPSPVTINIGAGNGWFSPISPELLFVRVQSSLSPENLFLGYVSQGDYNVVTGDLTIRPISVRGNGIYSDWKVSPTNLTSSPYVFNYYENWFKPGGFYSWERLPYLDFYEIEWTIYKEDERPYYFQIRGELPDYEVLPHFLPYTGEYTVQCRLWDTLNAISLGIKRNVIKVEKRDIELNTLTRFRQSEVYNFNNMPLKWDSYPSQWEFPVESTESVKNISDTILNFPEYGNNFNEGQFCEVLTDIPEVRSTCSFEVGVSQRDIISIVSTFNGTGYTFAVVTTTTNHGYSSGDQVWIYDSSGDPYGSFPITVLSANTFEIPQIVLSPISGGYVYGTGRIRILADGMEIADVSFLGDLNSTTAQIYSSVNSSPLFPKYRIISLTDSQTQNFKTVVLQAPNNTGTSWNGKLVSLMATGSIITNPQSVLFTGGANQTKTFVPFDFTSYPTQKMKSWGTKAISWDTFENFEFSKAYAHTWDMYDYHNDWLGGFSLYSLQYGDRIRVSSLTNGVVMTEIDTPPNNYLDLSEAVEQLNGSEDENITRFDYVVRGYSDLPLYYDSSGSSISPDLSTNPGPKNIISSFYKIPTYSPSIFVPTGLSWDADGDIWVTGEDVVKFDGLNFIKYDSSNSPIPGTGISTLCVKIDQDDVKWIGIENEMIPLVRINEIDPSKSLAYSVNDFVDNGGNPVVYPVPSSVRVIEINPQNGDIFASFASSSSPSSEGLLYFDGRGKSWSLLTPGNSAIPSANIRDLRLQYYDINKWFLWIATDQGLSRFNGVNFKNYDTTNSGLPSNDLYSIELDSLNHKWIGTSSGIVYWDHLRWAVWSNSTNSELTQGNVTNIVETGNANVWFIVNPVSSPGDNELFFFDGYHFTRVLYRNDGTSLISPCPNFYGKSSLSAPWKTIKNGEITYPKNLIFLTNSGEIGKLDYLIPHIHATSKFSGISGWDFVYHETSIPLPAIQYVYNSGIGTSQLNFNFVIGPLYENITLDSDSTRPVMPSVDRKSWNKPGWQRYSLDRLKKQFPSLNLDDVFLYAPLRDIIKGKATKEAYWRNSQIEKISQKKSRNLFDNFEWLITLGNSGSDQGVKVTIDTEGDVIVIGDYNGSIFMGEVNNISTQDVYLNSSDPSVFVAKYNKAGVIQWARSINPPIGGQINARSVITDTNSNIYVVFDESISGFIQLNKYNSDGILIDFLNLPISPVQKISDVKIDIYENVYICGEFEGALTMGNFLLDSFGVTSGFLAKLDSTLNFVWAKKLETQNFSSVSEISLLEEGYFYATGVFNTGVNLGPLTINGPGIPDSFIGKFLTENGTCVWGKNLAKDSSTSFGEPSITTDINGHILITGGFNGTIEIESQSISSFPGTTDIFVMKLLSTGKLVWVKMCGGASGNESFDIESDSEENVYITGAYSGTSYFSPEEVISRGGTDIYLTKFNKEGTLVDIVTAGGINNDKGADLVLDEEENLYLTGYFTGSGVDFSEYVTSSPQGGAEDAFLGKIPKQRFQSGIKIGSVQSWLGSHSWSWKEDKLYENEFEIPVASTIFINPIDSLIPGKKNHIWTLVNVDSEEEIIRIRKTPYFIWTFLNPGFYTISCQVEDANGNLYETTHEGKIKVIDHKIPSAGDLIPNIVNPEDYLLRTSYDSKNSLGFPPDSKFVIG
jgi:hypothetical protein